jgi:hypothetical protein
MKKIKLMGIGGCGGRTLWLLHVYSARENFDHAHITSRSRPFLHYRGYTSSLEEAGRSFLAMAMKGK